MEQGYIISRYFCKMDLKCASMWLPRLVDSLLRVNKNELFLHLQGKCHFGTEYLVFFYVWLLFLS